MADLTGIYGPPTRVPAIPDVRTAKTETVITALKEWVEVREGARGDGLDKAVTLRDLLNSGLATPFDLRGLQPGGIQPIPLGPGEQDPDIPPTPERLEATGAFKYILLTWEFARGYSRLANFEVWRSTTNAIGDAVLIAQPYGIIYADEVGPGKSYYYWVRAVSDAPATSPFNALEGTLGATQLDPGYLLDLLAGQITESQLYQDLGDRINLIDATAEVAGSVAARVKAETDARVEAIDAEIEARMLAIQGEAEAREAYVQEYTYSKLETNSALAIQATTITTAYEAYADAVESSATSTAAADVRNYAYSKSDINAAEAAQTNAITTGYTTYTDGKTGEVLTAAAADVRNYAYSKSDVNGALASLATELRGEMQSTSGVSAAYVQNYTYSKAEFDQAQAGQNNTLTTNYTQYADTKKTEAISAAAADVRNYSYSKSSVDGALTTQFNTLTTNYQNYATDAAAGAVATASADVRSYAYSKAGTDGAIASATSTLQTTVDGHTTTIGSHTTTINGLSGQYVFKIDNNGYVSGFGLASTLTTAAPFSSFIVRSDSFAIASPEGPAVAPAQPFIVRTTATTINGVAVPVGVYIGAAFIQNGSISTAKIGNLQVDDAKIANMSVAKLVAGKLGVAEYIESTNYAAGDAGFIIRGNGNSEFQNTTVRGTIMALAGHIGNIQLSEANGIYSANYTDTTGFHIHHSGAAVFNQVRVRGELVSVYGTLGTLNILGHIRGGQTDYDTGTGFFEGLHNGIYKKSIGTTDGPALLWDGTNLILRQPVVNRIEFTVSISGFLPPTVANGVVTYGAVHASTANGKGVIKYRWYVVFEAHNGIADVNYAVITDPTLASATLRGRADSMQILASVFVDAIDEEGRIARAERPHWPTHGTYVPQ